MERLKIISPEEQERFSSITNRVNVLLSKKTMYEKRRQDEFNKTKLGGVTFFYKFDFREDGHVTNVTLCWDVHAKDWDNELILAEIDKEELEIEHSIYDKRLNETDEAFGPNPSFGNPFRN